MKRASGLHEALPAHREFGKEVHVCIGPAFKEEEMKQILPIAGHLSFNSLQQWQKFKPVLAAARRDAPSPGAARKP